MTMSDQLSLTSNGNRTEWSPIRSVIFTSDKTKFDEHGACS